MSTQQRIQKSLSFVLPVLKLRMPDFSIGLLQESGLRNSYMGDVNYQGNTNWGEFFYLSFSLDKLTDECKRHLESHPGFIGSYTTTEGDEVCKMFVFNFTEEERKSIVKPFLDGKYSEIDRSYVERFFPKTRQLPGGKSEPSRNRRILDKSEELRKLWEIHLDVDFEDDWEVWARPEKEDEVRGYVHQEQVDLIQQ